MTELTNNAAIEERRGNKKEAILDVLKEMPIIQVACRKIGISRPTFYRWRREDKAFRQQSGEAMALGIEFINDMSESQLITLIREKKMPAIALWLKYNNERYGAKIRPHVLLDELLDSADPRSQEQWDDLQKVAEEYEEELRKALIKQINEK